MPVSINEAIEKKYITIGTYVLVRVDFNVSMDGNTVRDDYRIARALPTILALTSAGAKVILISHIELSESKKHGLTAGKNDADKSAVPSLQPVYDYIKTTYPKEFNRCYFVPDLLSEQGKKQVSLLKEGEIILAENIRMYEGEKKNDTDFAAALASLATVYVNDAFAVSHRAHASVVGVPALKASNERFAGLLLQSEIEALDPSIQKPRPFIFILGGAKFETKLPLITKYLDVADHVFVGGALANDLFKLQGNNVGNSLVSTDKNIEESLREILKNKKLIIPEDVFVLCGQHIEIKHPEDVKDGENILDIGPESLVKFESLCENAGYIVWNGPLGDYERGFEFGTLMLAKILANLNHNKTRTVVGGGDTLAAIKKANVFDKFGFVSTGGGAMLEYLEKGTLVGVEVLK